MDKNISIFYRISDTGYNKVKPTYVNNENCLHNFVKHFGSNLNIIADNVSDETLNMIQKYVDIENIQQVSIGNGAETFTLAFEHALEYDDDTIIYFVENDYIHRDNSLNVLFEGFDLNCDYLTLYDHPDKYMFPENGGNKFCIDGAENTRVYCSKSTHWKLTNSTTMTFASKVRTLKEDEDIIRKFTCGLHPETNQKTGHPYDFSMFVELNKKGRSLLSPIPSYSTHGETSWLSNFINWGEQCQL
jgi:hypothetical protein